ncbi:MAG: pilus assembly protein PilP [Rhodocyclaceae bacterium]|nr:pilus assembly protein PilP [Rhodocyclaceae bacterium]
MSSLPWRRRGWMVMTCWLAACTSGEPQDLKQWMQEESSRLVGRVPPLPELKPFPIVAYEGASLSDPFSPDRLLPERRDGAGRKPDLDRPREPLEEFPLESLTYVGHVRKKRGGIAYGLVKAGNAIHPVRVGNHLGQNFGRITEITESQIRLVEIVQDPTGQTNDWVEREAVLELQEAAPAKEKGK